MPTSVLIADDDANIVLALRFVMEKAGFEVATAADGEATLAALTERPFNILLLDVMMPKRNGYEVCRAIRADHRLAELRIVMLTAKGRDAERRLGLDAGADGYITKPFSIRDVLDGVQRFAGAQGPAPQRISGDPEP